MVIAGFKDFKINELNACDFSDQNLRNWVTHVSSKTKEGFAEIIPLPTKIVSNATRIEKLSEQTWILLRHMLLLPF